MNNNFKFKKGIKLLKKVKSPYSFRNNYLIEYFVTHKKLSFALVLSAVFVAALITIFPIVRESNIYNEPFDHIIYSEASDIHDLF